MPGGRELSLDWAIVAPEGATACPPAVCALCPPPKASGLPSVHFVIIAQSHCLFAAPAPPPPQPGSPLEGPRCILLILQPPELNAQIGES